MRQLCAHWPRLAERPPHASLVRHWPLHDTHSAPCTNTSSSASVPAAKRSISATDSSRGTTMRVQPSAVANAAAAGSAMVICVLACSSSCGQIARASRQTAGSCTISASTPEAAMPRSACSSAGSSGSNTSVFIVT